MWKITIFLPLSSLLPYHLILSCIPIFKVCDRVLIFMDVVEKNTMFLTLIDRLVVFHRSTWHGEITCSRVIVSSLCNIKNEIIKHKRARGIGARVKGKIQVRACCVWDRFRHSGSALQDLLWLSNAIKTHKIYKQKKMKPNNQRKTKEIHWCWRRRTPWSCRLKSLGTKRPEIWS